MIEMILQPSSSNWLVRLLSIEDQERLAEATVMVALSLFTNKYGILILPLYKSYQTVTRNGCVGFLAPNEDILLV